MHFGLGLWQKFWNGLKLISVISHYILTSNDILNTDYKIKMKFNYEKIENVLCLKYQIFSQDLNLYV